MSDKIIMLCIVLAAVAVTAVLFIRRAIIYRRRTKEAIGENISPEEIEIKVAEEKRPRKTGIYYRTFFFRAADSCACDGKYVRIHPKYHAYIKAMVRTFGKKGMPVTIYSYLDNVLEHHFQSFGEEISDLYPESDDNH